MFHEITLRGFPTILWVHALWSLWHLHTSTNLLPICVNQLHTAHLGKGFDPTSGMNAPTTDTFNHISDMTITDGSNQLKDTLSRYNLIQTWGLNISDFAKYYCDWRNNSTKRHYKECLHSWWNWNQTGFPIAGDMLQARRQQNISAMDMVTLIRQILA